MTAVEEAYDVGAHPRRELYQHIMVKGFQFGAFVGTAIGLPVLAVRAKGAPALDDVGYVAAVASGLGVGLSCAMGAAKARGFDTAQFEDRAYRLHYNAGQRRVDHFCAVGGSVGAVALGVRAASAAPQIDGAALKNVALAAVGGAAIGMTVALLAHVATMRGSLKPVAMTKEILD
eukprot:CAMPEP_0185833710 /NCGR_PEP_ID=MMETSP1353-20130828/3331_1 /TAXON_ID=1077150 /ORGANISM="Erythrolobus australicus, Strain CCMP3124" /LENGTH=174 /DNA_ID=CAMNT_0028532033 /DNA_START=25 /DNA_END=549 /DNA_ORIENTATION=+